MSRPVALLTCDLAPSLGVGHFMRCLALAEELARGGFTPVFGADVDSVPFAAEQLARRGLRAVPPGRDAAGLTRVAESVGAVVHVVDSYVIPTEAYARLRGAARPLLVAIVDGDTGGRAADLYVDQNLGSEDLDVWTAPGSRRLAGLAYALLRDDVTSRRPARPADGAPRGDVVSAVAFFGGTDPFDASVHVSRALVATGEPVDVTVVAPRDEQRTAIAALTPAPGQRLRPIAPTADLPALVADADVVLSGAGTSTWELMCLGSAVGLLQVAENQRLGYDALAAARAAVPLGRLEDGTPTDTDPGALRDLLRDADRRTALRERAWALVDDQGRRRVVEAVTALLTSRSAERADLAVDTNGARP